MGARITIETVTYQRRRHQIDQLGYLFCGDCTDEDRGGHFDEYTDRQPPQIIEHCDGCGKEYSDWPTSTGTAKTVVEHTPCRIF